MRDFAFAVIAAAAQEAGLPAEKVINKVKKDNLTLDRPRLEVQCLPETYKRTGRSLAFARSKTKQSRKLELYEVELEIAANVLADNEAWLTAFCYDFVAALPRGKNDNRGNWVQIRAVKAALSRPPDKRVGDDVIEAFCKVNQLFNLTFTGRITAEQAKSLIQTFKIQPILEN